MLGHRRTLHGLLLMLILNLGGCASWFSDDSVDPAVHLVKVEVVRAKLLELSAERGFEGERGEGLLRALLLGKDIGPQIVEKARELQPTGLLLNAARPNLLRFMPALNVTNEEIDQMMAMLRTVLDSL